MMSDSHQLSSAQTFIEYASARVCVLIHLSKCVAHFKLPRTAAAAIAKLAVQPTADRGSQSQSCSCSIMHIITEKGLQLMLMP